MMIRRKVDNPKYVVVICSQGQSSDYQYRSLIGAMIGFINLRGRYHKFSTMNLVLRSIAHPNLESTELQHKHQTNYEICYICKKRFELSHKNRNTHPIVSAVRVPKANIDNAPLCYKCGNMLQLLYIMDILRYRSKNGEGVD